MATEIRARLVDYDNCIHVVILERSIEGHRTARGEPVKMVEITPDTHIFDPTFTLDKTQAQQLIDQLWNCGVRPTEGSGSAGALAATERHLKDMQRLVFEEKKPILSAAKGPGPVL